MSDAEAAAAAAAAGSGAEEAAAAEEASTGAPREGPAGSVRGSLDRATYVPALQRVYVQQPGDELRDLRFRALVPVHANDTWTSAGQEGPDGPAENEQIKRELWDTEVQVFTYLDMSLDDVLELVVAERPAVAREGTFQYSFASVFPNRGDGTGVTRKQLGTTTRTVVDGALQPIEQAKDVATLTSLRHVPGDYLALVVLDA